MSSQRVDAIVVGAGILGLAHAALLAKLGFKVAVFERGAIATGASIRNFGMIWPVGQPPGELREIALRSRELWLAVLNESGIWFESCGSLTLSYADDELKVLQEFVEKGASRGYEAKLLSSDEINVRYPNVRQQHLRGGMRSETEVCVFPRQVVWQLPNFLTSLGVEFHFNTAVTEVETGKVTAGGQTYLADQIFICSGDDYETLFPALFRESGLTRSKLQMMRAQPKDPSFRIGTHLCAGLTLAHYNNFKICDRLESLVKRFESEMGEHMKWGIHLLVSQHEDGGLTIGDSHEYGLAVTPFLQQKIDELILGYLDTFLDVSQIEVIERWSGVYSKHPTKPYVMQKPLEGVQVVTGVGGAGMTLSFGLAEKSIRMMTF